MKKSLIFLMVIFLLAYAKDSKKYFFNNSSIKAPKFTEVNISRNWSTVANGIPFTSIAGQSYNIGNISIVDSMTAWAFAYIPGSNGTRTGNKILLTTDGVTWQDKGSVKVGTAQKHYVMSILGLSKDTCIVVTGPMSGNGEILRTTNGGSTWTVVHTYSGAWFNIIDIQNDGTIWAQSDPTDTKFYLVKSTDRGATWTRTGLDQPTLITGEAGWANYWYSDGKNIWFPTGKNRIFKSTNGIDGPWTASQPLTNITDDPNANIGPIAFYDQNIGFVGYQGDNELYKTTDGGNSFFQSPYFPADSILDLRFLPNSTKLYAATLNGISVSDNLGKNWVVDSIEYFNKLPTLSVRFKGKTGFGAGVSGYMSKYTPATAPVQVVFVVDMGKAIKNGIFNPNDDALVVSGNFTEDAEMGTNWSYLQQLDRRTSTMAKDSIFIYSLQLKRTYIGKEYKFTYSIVKPQTIINSNDTLDLFIPSADYALPKYKFPTSNPTSNENNKITLFYDLQQNYPNPFNPTTVIAYNIPTTSVVKLEIYDVLGKHIQTLVNDVQNAGTYKINYSANNLPSGIYIAKLTANNYTKTIKMMLLK